MWCPKCEGELTWPPSSARTAAITTPCGSKRDANHEDHASEHQVIESWIAAADHDARAALARLLDAGLTRDEAIHALGAAFRANRERDKDAETLEELEALDDALEGELAAVEPRPWRGTVP